MPHNASNPIKITAIAITTERDQPDRDWYAASRLNKSGAATRWLMTEFPER